MYFQSTVLLLFNYASYFSSSSVDSRFTSGRFISSRPILLYFISCLFFLCINIAFYAPTPRQQQVLSVNCCYIIYSCLYVSCHCNRPISQTVFMLSIAINRAKHVCATVIIKHNCLLICNPKIVINILLCLLNSIGHI